MGKKPNPTTSPAPAQKPSAYRVTYRSSTDFVLDEGKELFWSERMATDYAKNLVNGAQVRNSAWAEARVIPLFRDKDRGTLRAGKGVPFKSYKYERI